MTTLSLRLLIPNVMLNGSLRKLELHFLENWHLLIRVKSGTGLDPGTAVQVIVTMQRTFKEGPRDKSRACSQVIGTLRKMEGRRRSWFFFPTYCDKNKHLLWLPLHGTVCHDEELEVTGV